MEIHMVNTASGACAGECDDGRGDNYMDIYLGGFLHACLWDNADESTLRIVESN